MDPKIIKALGDPKRFMLMQLMSRQGYCVSALARLTELSESAVSQHLKIMREAGLVSGVKRGYYTHYSVDKQMLNSIIDELIQMRDSDRKPCFDPQNGCSEAQYIKCRAFSNPENNTKEE